MEIFIKYSNGHSEWIECSAFNVANNVIEITTDAVKEQDGHTLGNKQYIPLFNVEKYILCNSSRTNRYIQ